MIIGINCRNLTNAKLEGFGNYTFEITKRLIESHPEHSFLLIFDRKTKHPLPFYKNCKEIILSPATRHPILYFIWFELQIPRILKKEKVDLFFSPDGFNSLRSKIPSIITIHDLNFEHNPGDLPKFLRRYLHRNFRKFAQKANQIITVSNYSKKDIEETYQISSEKIHVIYNAANEGYLPLSEVEQNKIVNSQNRGKEYLLFVGSIHPRKNVQRLLEAFALLENPKYDLLIAGDAMWKNKEIIQPEKNKDSIHFLGYVPAEELFKLMAAASALVYVPYFEGFGIPLVEAMSCGTPIIAANATCLPEIAGEAALYCDPFDIHSIKNAIEKLMNDKDLQNELKQKGLKRSKQFSWNIAAKKISELLIA